MLPHVPLELKLEAWPARHQALWAAGTAPGRSLDGDKYAATLRPYTVRLAMKAYGRFLAFLACRGELDPEVGPGDLVWPERLQAFVDELRAAGNNDNTIATRLWGLRTALEIMEKRRKFRWITSPDGDAIRALLPQVPRTIMVPHAQDMRDWGAEKLDAAEQASTPLGQARAFRDGLIVALFAVRGLRLETFWRMRLGEHVLPTEGGYRLQFEPHEMKTKKAIAFPLPPSLVPGFARYIDVERPVLLRGQTHDWFWVSQLGGPMRKRAIEAVIRRASEARFGEAFGTHRFRHSIGTTAPLANPSGPAIAAAMLGASQAVVEAHYNLGNQQCAAQRFHEVLRREREKSADLAERSLKRRR